MFIWRRRTARVSSCSVGESGADSSLRSEWRVSGHTENLRREPLRLGLIDATRTSAHTTGGSLPCPARTLDHESHHRVLVPGNDRSCPSRARPKPRPSARDPMKWSGPAGPPTPIRPWSISRTSTAGRSTSATPWQRSCDRASSSFGAATWENSPTAARATALGCGSGRRGRSPSPPPSIASTSGSTATTGPGRSIKTTPPVQIALDFGAAGGRHVRVPLGPVHWREWWVMHHKLDAQEQEQLRGATFEGIEVGGGRNPEDRLLFFDNLSVYREALPPLRFAPGRSAASRSSPARRRASIRAPANSPSPPAKRRSCPTT